ncbi:hydroxydechloroatrazine ethylaminohydrolase, partial [mine drainage metagenome]
MSDGAKAGPVVLTGALLVTQDARRRVVRGDLRIEGGRFTHVGPDAPRTGAEVVDATVFAAVPGFVNTHGHVAMSLLRGIADERDLSGFLKTL